MKKVRILLPVLVCLFLSSEAFSMQTSVEITGPQELRSLKEGIEKSVTARCIARGIAVDTFGKLTITISKLGDTISYDALLDTKPPKAFHKDLKDASTLSATMDEMIIALFGDAQKAQTPPILPKKEPQVQGNGQEIKLPLQAISITAVGDKLFICDKKTVYDLTNLNTPVWQAPGNNEILRLYTYGESIIVLTKIMNNFRSFTITGTGVVNEQWSRAVIPFGSGLISTDIIFNRELGAIPYTWSNPKQERGSSPQIPEGLDILSALSFETKAASAGFMTISYNHADTMVIRDGKSTICTEDKSVGNSPQFLDDTKVERDYTGSEPNLRYYLKPRIALVEGTFFSPRNSLGSTKIVAGLNLFESALIFAYKANAADGEFTKSELASFPDGYCTDIAVSGGRIVALVVKGKFTYVQFIGL